MEFNWTKEELKFFDEHQEDLNSGDLDRIGQAIRGFGSYWGRIRVGLAMAKILGIKVITEASMIGSSSVYIPFGSARVGLGLINSAVPYELQATIESIIHQAGLPADWKGFDFT